MGSVYSRKLDVPGTVHWHRGQMAQEWPIFILLNALTLQNRVATCKLPCGNCFWHTLAPKPYPGSVWRRPEWSVPKLSWSMLWQCNSVDAQAPVSGNTPRYRLPYRHRQNWTLLPHSWLSLGQECYGPFRSFFSAPNEKMALPPHTHHGSLWPNVLSSMRPIDLNLFELRKTFFHWSHCLLFWLVLLLWGFLYTSVLSS